MFTFSSFLFGRPLFADDEHVTFFASYGILDDDEWVIEIRLRVSEPRPAIVSAVTAAAAKSGMLNPDELTVFQKRIAPFVSDSESSEHVEFVFDGDPSSTRFTPLGKDRKPVETDGNGIAVGQIRLSVQLATELLKSKGSRNGWLRFSAVSREHQGVGYVQLIKPTGVSVISDIDDTIRITEMRAGAATVTRNTMAREFQETYDMPRRYHELGDVAFHYVSASPTQLYQPLWDFINENERYPMGSFHMRSLGKNLTEQATWEQLIKLLSDGASTVELKTRHIESILAAFPERTFILIGDSGESDPEIYQAVRERHPAQIREIWIRDVGDDTANADRCRDMVIIPSKQSP